MGTASGLAPRGLLAACAVTIGASNHVLRPLYEGVGPAAPYRWVHPPAQFAATNVKPSPTTQTIDLTASGSVAAGASSGDGQLVLSFPVGTIAPLAGASAVLISITPVDPAKLGSLPVGAYSDGNAYHVTATYQPGGVPVAVARHPVDAVVVTPVPSAEFLTSPDGKTWRLLLYHHIPSQAAVATTFTQFGYLLAAASNPVVVNSVAGGSRILIVVILGAIAVVPLLGAFIWRKGRRRTDSST